MQMSSRNPISIKLSNSLKRTLKELRLEVKVAWTHIPELRAIEVATTPDVILQCRRMDLVVIPGAVNIFRKYGVAR